MKASQESQPPHNSEEERKEKKGDKVDIALDVSAVVMSTLHDVAKLPPIPGLSEAVGAAVAIINIVQVS